VSPRKSLLGSAFSAPRHHEAGPIGDRAEHRFHVVGDGSRGRVGRRGDAPEAITGAVIIIAANGFLHTLAIRMDRTRFSAGRENPPAEYVFEVICEVDVEIAIKSQIVGVVTRPGFQLESLRSFDTGTPNQV
jgi:hypothetical protein